MRINMDKKYKDIELKTDLNWRKQTLRFQCCDCGLVHDYEFVVSGSKIRIITTRNNRATGQIRRYRNITIRSKK